MRKEQIKPIKKAIRIALAFYESSPRTAEGFGMDAATASKLRRIEPTLIEPTDEPDPAKKWRSLQAQARKRLFRYASDCEI